MREPVDEREEERKKTKREKREKKKNTNYNIARAKGEAYTHLGRSLRRRASPRYLVRSNERNGTFNHLTAAPELTRGTCSDEPAVKKQRVE